MNTQLQHRNALQARFAPALEVRFQGGAEPGAISGLASVFGGPPDSYGDIIAPGAFKRTIAEHKAGGTMPVMLWSHHQDEPIGRWTSMSEDAKGLAVKGVLNLDTSRGRDTYAHLKAGDVTGMSIGFFLPPGGATRNPDGSQTLVDIDLAEISIVALPANRRARVELGSKGELIDLLQKSGLPKQAAVRVAAGGWGALSRNDDEQAAAVVARIQKAAARLKGQQ